MERLSFKSALVLAVVMMLVAAMPTTAHAQPADSLTFELDLTRMPTGPLLPPGPAG